MTATERTYSFRAPTNFEERLMRARTDFLVIASDAKLSADLGRELPLALWRRFEQLDADASDGLVARTILDAFTSATARVRSEHVRMTELAAIDRA